jgi:hypothetical protein
MAPDLPKSRLRFASIYALSAVSAASKIAWRAACTPFSRPICKFGDERFQRIIGFAY